MLLESEELATKLVGGPDGTIKLVMMIIIQGGLIDQCLETIYSWAITTAHGQIILLNTSVNTPSLFSKEPFSVSI